MADALITPEGVASYPKVFKSELPKDAKPGDKKAWSVTLLMDKAATQTEEFKAMVQAAFNLLREKCGPTVSNQIEWIKEGKDKGRSFVRYTFENKNGAREDGILYMPFRNDVAAKGYPENFVLFINPRKTDDPDKNIRPPEVITRGGVPIKDPREIYPGVRCRVSLGVFAYDQRGNKGVSFGLNNVQKLGDGPRIDNTKDAKDEFGTLPDETPAGMPDAADLSSFVG